MAIASGKEERSCMSRMRYGTSPWVRTFWFFYRSIILTISVISNQTAFDVDFCFRMVMSTYHHAATFEGLADEFNDLHCKGILFFVVVHKI